MGSWGSANLAPSHTSPALISTKFPAAKWVHDGGGAMSTNYLTMRYTFADFRAQATVPMASVKIESNFDNLNSSRRYGHGARSGSGCGRAVAR